MLGPLADLHRGAGACRSRFRQIAIVGNLGRRKNRDWFDHGKVGDLADAREFFMSQFDIINESTEDTSKIIDNPRDFEV